MPLNIDIQQILLHLLNFAILFTGLYVILYKPVKEFMEKRQEHFKEMEEKAEAAKSDAEKLKKQYEDKLAASDAEISEKKSKAEAELGAIRKDRLEKAEADADKIIRDAKDTAEREKKRIIRSADDEAKDIIAEAAEHIVNSSLSDNFDAFLRDAERGKQ
ncbi:MAG TPA: hypothetical protein DCY81_09600 [Lachnospiraceae bacterium]|nr:hypothetical protein [Lachnospiraceae bacterium]